MNSLLGPCGNAGGLSESGLTLFGLELESWDFLFFFGSTLAYNSSTFFLSGRRPIEIIVYIVFN